MDTDRDHDNAAGFPIQAGSRQLAASEFERVRVLASSLAGIDLPAHKHAMAQRRLSRAAAQAGFASAGKLIEALSIGSVEDTQRFINALTTNKTSFFREPHHFNYLAAQIAQLRVRPGRNRDREFRALSCGCSTGEETYSVAIAVLASLPDSRQWTIQIDGIDIDTDVIAFAQKGSYPAASHGDIPTQFRLSYLLGPGVRRGGDLQVSQRLRECTKFNRGSVFSNDFGVASYDAIFFRNVAIYFSPANKIVALRKLTRALKPGGQLYLGHSESLPGEISGFRQIGKSCYQKDMHS